MINYSAFPIRKSKRRAWWLIPTILILTSIVIAVILIALPDQHMRVYGLRLFQITVYIVSVVGGLITLILPIWFIWKIIIPRVRNRLSGDYDAGVINLDFIVVNAQFAKDNGFSFKEHTYRAPAPAALYKDLIKKNDGDDISILYEVTGGYAGANFRFYCLAIATRENLALKDGMAYAYQSDGRYVEYTTILQIPYKASLSVKKPLQIVNNGDATIIYANGYVNDRDTAMKMFSVLDQA